MEAKEIKQNYELPMKKQHKPGTRMGCIIAYMCFTINTCKQYIFMYVYFFFLDFGQIYQ